MPRVSDFELLQRGEQPILSVRKTAPLSSLPALITEAYKNIAALLKEAGTFPSDVPFVIYHTMDTENLDVEMCFPVATPLPGKGEVSAGFIPAGKFAFCVFRGPYMEIEPAYAEMITWIADNGYKTEGTAYEHYYTGPGTPQNEALTKILMPVS